MARKLGWIFGGAAFLVFVHLWWRAAALGPFPGRYLINPNFPLAIVWDLALMIFFAASHSLFASHWFKRRRKRPPQLERQVFLILNFITVAFVWMYWAPLPGPALWQIEGAPSLIFHAIQLLGLVGFSWTVRYFHLASFFGEKPETGKLEFSGPFALCRHPSYFFGILLLLSPQMPLGRAILAFSAMAYMVVGSHLEERKLLAEAGESYARYRRKTPWLIPTPASFRAAFFQ